MNKRSISLDTPHVWKEALKGIQHSFFHTWEWCYSLSLSNKQNTFLYSLEENDARVICPISERSFLEHVDIVTPYGFSGFTGTGNHDRLYYAWKQFTAGKGYVCGYIGLHPLFENKDNFDPSEYHTYNNIYILDLTQSEDELFASLSENRRRQIKKNKECISTYEREKLGKFFLDNYSEFLKQRRASSAYNFSPETLLSLIDLDNVLILGAGQPNKIEAVSLFAYTPYGGDFLFNVSLPEGKRHSAPLIWSALLQLKSFGIPFLNLGGGISKDDSLAQFKERFGGRKVPLSCLKQVYKPEIYRKLCLQLKKDPDDYSGYFPPYRNSNILS